MHDGRSNVGVPYGTQVLFDPDPLDRTEQCCGVSLPAIFSGVCTMDLLADTHFRAKAVVPSNVLLLEAPTRRPTFRQPEFSRASTHGRAKEFPMSVTGGISRRSLVIAGATLGAPLKLAAQDRADTVEIADSETATIDGS